MEKRDLCPGFLRQKPKKENSKVTAKNVREDIGKNGSMQEIRQPKKRNDYVLKNIAVKFVKAQYVEENWIKRYNICNIALD